MLLKLTSVFILLVVSFSGNHAYPSQPDNRMFTPAGVPFWSFYMVPAEAFEVAQQAAQPAYPEVMTLKRKRAGPDNTPDFDGLWATRG